MADTVRVRYEGPLNSLLVDQLELRRGEEADWPPHTVAKVLERMRDHSLTIVDQPPVVPVAPESPPVSYGDEATDT